MAQLSNPLTSYSYTNKDFQSVYVELLDLAKNLSSRWDPSISNESDPGVILLKLNAIIADKCNYTIDNSILECFPDTVSQLQNARRLFEQLGYSMHWYRSATTPVSIQFTKKDSKDSYYTIPKFTMITDDDSQTVYTLIGNLTNDIVVSDLTLKTDGSICSALAMQGVAVNYEINGDTTITVQNLDSRNRLYFPTNTVAENGVFITNVNNTNYQAWIRKDNLNVEEPGNTYYKFGVSEDGNYCYIEFPDDVNELFKNGVNITYIRSQGRNGNIAASTLTKFYYAFSPKENSSVTFGYDNIIIKNSYATSNGYDYDSIDEGYNGYKKTIGTFETLVTLRDYINYILKSNLASNGFVCDRTNDIQCSYDIVSSEFGSTISRHNVELDVVYGYMNQNRFYKGKLTDGTLYNEITDLAETTVYFDKESDKCYRYVDNTWILSQAPVMLDAFSIKLYLTKNVENAQSLNDFVNSFTLQDIHPGESGHNAIQDYIYDVKSVQHDFKYIIEPSESSSHICFFKNKFPLKCKIIPKYVLTAYAANEVLENVISSLYSAFYAKNLELGQELTLSKIYDTIVGSDDRISSVSIDPLDYTTYAVYYDASDSTNPFKEVDISTVPVNKVNAEYAGLDANTTLYIDDSIYTEKVGCINYNKMTLKVDSTNNWHIDGLTDTVKLSDFGVFFKKVRVYTNNTNYITLSDETSATSTSPSSILRLESVKRNGVDYTGYYYIDYSNNMPVIRFTKPITSTDEIEISLVSTNYIISDPSIAYITLRYSKSIQFRNEIYAKSVLAGNTQLLDSDNAIELTYNQDSHYHSSYSNASKMTSNVTIPFDATNDTYVLKPNEVIQLVAPNLLEEKSYSNYVKFEFHVQSVDQLTVEQGQTYQLKPGQYIFFYWKQTSSDDSYQYAAYGPGNIIRPTFDLRSTQTAIGSYIETNLNESNSYRLTSNEIALTTEASELIDKNLIGSQHSLTTSKSISILKLNSITLNNDSVFYWYCITNHTIENNNQKYYTISTNSEVILNTGEYFIYTDKYMSNMSIIGAGSSVYIDDKIQQIKDVSNTNDTYSIVSSTQIVDTDKIIVQVNGSIVDKSKYTLEKTNNDTKVTITLDSSFAPYPSTITVTYSEARLTTWSVPVVDVENIIHGNGIEVLKSAWSQIPDTASVRLTENQFITIPYGYVVQISNLVTDLSLTRELVSLQNHGISYKIAGDTNYTKVPMIELEEFYWKGRAILNVHINGTEPYTLYNGQSLTVYKDNGDVKTYDGDGVYCFKSSIPISFDGTELDNYVTTIKQDGAKQFPLIYRFKLLPQETTQSDGSTIVCTDTQLTFRFAQGSTSVTHQFGLLGGTYILPFVNSEKLKNIKVTYSMQASNPIEFVTIGNGSYVGKDLSYLQLDVPLDLRVTITVERTGTDLSEATVTFRNPYKYTRNAIITESDFDCILKLIQQFDTQDIFDYTYRVDDSHKVENPLSPEAFFNINFLYNKFVLSQIDVQSSDNSIQVVNKL